MNRFLQGLLTTARGAVGLLYAAAGAFLFASDVDVLGLGLELRRLFGALLVAYGIFRIVRAFRHEPIGN